jgi:hypothetical protein
MIQAGSKVRAKSDIKVMPSGIMIYEGTVMSVEEVRIDYDRCPVLYFCGFSSYFALDLFEEVPSEVAQPDESLIAVCREQSQQLDVLTKERDKWEHIAKNSNGVYEHYKGHLYFVLGHARHTETDEELTIYVPLYTHPDGGLPKNV